LPGPDIASQAMQGGSTTTVEYDYAMRQQQEGLGGDRIDQLLPALIAWAEKRPAITGMTASASVASVRVESESRDDFSGAVAWRILDWEGEIIGSGSAKIDAPAGKGGRVSIPLPDLSNARIPEGAGMGRFVRLRAALLSADRRQVLSCVDRHVEPNPLASVVLRPDEKLARLNEQTGSLARRVLHESLDQLPDSFVYLPGEPVTIRALMENNSGEMCKANLSIEAVPAFSGKPVKKTVTYMILPYLQAMVPIRIEPEQTQTEQPWSVTVELRIDDQPVTSRSTMSFVVARPRGEIADLATVTAQGHSAGGYMWQMTPHAWPMEHLAGTDARHPGTDPRTPSTNLGRGTGGGGGPWWLRCRESSDGNWLIAQGVHREDQGGLLWGAFYDQYRGEVVDSYGWFPNGQSFREWWAPYAMREPLRRNGRRPCIFALSDWWQYDAGYPENHYATLQMFNEWLAANKGKRIAGTLLDGRPIQAGTMAEMRRIIADSYQHVFDFFIAQGLADCARFTGEQLAATAPGTTQMGQGCYAHRLPGTRGGSGIGPLWASYETTGILDADNHPFAGDWQYALESVAFRAIGVNNLLQTHWETPMRYHRVNDTGRHFVPLSAAQWRRRLLDSRWQTIADSNGRFQRVFNVTHTERLDGECELVEDGKTRIGGGRLPYHWWIKDRLAALAMTIAPARPLNPLLVVGECDLDWFGFYSLLGQFRNAGLTFGGGVSIAGLDKLKPEDIPALVWIAAPEVDDAALAAIERKITSGVPVLIIGNAPAAAGQGPDSGLRKLLGLRYSPVDGDGEDSRQTVSAECAAWPEAVGAEQLPAATPLPAYANAAGSVKALVERAGRVVLGVDSADGRRVVFYSATPRPEQRDPAVQQMAVRALHELVKPAASFPAGLAGYAFEAQDGDQGVARIYVVVLNLQMRPADRNCTIRVNDKRVTPKWRAADMLSGKAVPLRAAKTGVELDVQLDAASGTVIGMRNEE
ncbi:MAG TPA: hypothetical protein VM186_09210, partial [Planctomycetota bacterium]|nr:hypothetical protein [Planctomycetota bacterium]